MASPQIYTRRHLLASLGLGGLAMAAEKPVAGEMAAGAAWHVYPTVSDMEQDIHLKPGMVVQTLGFHRISDGGAASYQIATERLIAESGGDYPGTVNLKNGLTALLVNVQSVNYMMFGAVGDGQWDDGIQIKQAHDYANRKGLPVVNEYGEFWIKDSVGIEIRTNVQWGHTVFHIDERFNSKATSRFIVKSNRKKQVINLSPEAKKRFLAAFKPGVQILPELAPFRNTLVSVQDANDRIGRRAGRSNGQSWAREEIFYVEEHGRIIGDIAWQFNDYTSITAFPCDDNYLTIEGGTFYLSGNSPGQNYSGYWKNGFQVSRSRTIIRNQWVGLEGAGKDVAQDPRTGFYSFHDVYDITLENVRLVPWEKDRDDPDSILPAGTYGISAKRMMNGTFRNVTAEGGPMHWGVFGTNINKNFRIENCKLNRVDVHFHCWNLAISDSYIGYRGISVTGGGNLVITNTSCCSRQFINFRRDFGAKWDGSIRMTNCRYVPTSLDNHAVLGFEPLDFDYGYPIGLARRIHVDGLVIDFSTVPSSDKPCWLIAAPGFSTTSNGQHLFFPNDLVFRNVTVNGRKQGVRLLKLNNPNQFGVTEPGSVEDGRLSTNAKIWFEYVQLEALDMSSTDDAHVVFTKHAQKYGEHTCRLLPEIHVVNCKGFAGTFGGCIATVVCTHSTIAAINCGDDGSMPGSIAFWGCSFIPTGHVSRTIFYRLETTLGTSFINCVVHAPVIDGKPRFDLLDRLGFITFAEHVRFNHLNTRIGRDIISHFQQTGRTISRPFIERLKNHHELEDDAG